MKPAGFTLGDVFAAGWTLEAFRRHITTTYGEALATGQPFHTAQCGRRVARWMATLFGGEAHQHADAAAAAWRRNGGAADSPAPINPQGDQHAAE